MKSPKFFAALLIFTCFSLFAAVSMSAVNTPHANNYKADAELDAFFNIAVTKEPIYLILVEKNLQRLRVLEYDDQLRVVAEYPSATGENSGIKEISGDSKTPEGIYFITNVFKDDEITIFGDKAFHLDYPNFFDRKAGRNGNGIYIHGTNKELKPNSTNGCVTLRNNDLDNLEKYLNQVVTPVVIVSELDHTNTEKIKLLTENDFSLAQTLLLNDKLKLENVEYNYMYIISYGSQTVAVSDFIYRPFKRSIMRGASRTYLEYTTARTWEASKRIWRASPLQIYPESPVKIAAHPLSSGEVQLAEQSPAEADAMFAALSPRSVPKKPAIAGDTIPSRQITLKTQPEVKYTTQVAKVSLQAEKTPEVKQAPAAITPPVEKTAEIKPVPAAITPPVEKAAEVKPVPAAITPPVEKTAEVKPVPAATPQKTATIKIEQAPQIVVTSPDILTDKQQLLEFVENWRQAWVSKQIEPYIAFYDASFKSGNKNLSQWKAHKKNLNKTYAFITVNLSDIKVNLTDNGATVSFRQEYRSDRYSATGNKTLFLVHNSIGWKIKREVYSRI